MKYILVFIENCSQCPNSEDANGLYCPAINSYVDGEKIPENCHLEDAKHEN